MLLTPLCADGMAVAMHAASAEAPKYGAAMADDAQPMIMERGGSCDTPTMAALELRCLPSDGFATLAASGTATEPDAALMACIVILLAILVAVLGLPRPRLSRATLPPSQTGPGAFACSPRRPALAELCVLRT